MKLIKTIALGGLLAGVVASQAGCLLLAVGAGAGAGVAFMNGQKDAMLDGTPQQCAEAAKTTLNEMGYNVFLYSPGDTNGKVVGRSANAEQIEVNCVGQTDKVTRVYVRVGDFGDDNVTFHVLDKMKQHLEATAKAATTQPAVAAGSQPSTRPVTASTGNN